MAAVRLSETSYYGRDDDVTTVVTISAGSAA
jgi:hypothetical protein